MSVLNLNWWPTSGQMQGIMGQGGMGLSHGGLQRVDYSDSIHTE